MLFIFLISFIKSLQAVDLPNDAGGAIKLNWEFPETLLHSLMRFEIWRGKEKEKLRLRGISNTPSFIDDSTEDGVPYYYKVVAVMKDGRVYESQTVGPAVSSAQWFHTGRWNALILGVIFSFLILWYIRRARRGEKLFLRRIPGLDAVDEAVGRSTEMGRPVLFVLGLGYISDIPTIAGLSILSRVAKKAAEYETPVLVPCFDPVVMTAAQETVKQAYAEAGRPDLYNEKNIFYLTSDQFGYAAGVDGIMLRERPGAVFLQGYFFAESLILAETGYSIGAIQIAGTSAITQLPFFIAACDYTLIGEEMFVASTYLSREPVMLGSIKGEDFAKIILMILIAIGVICACIGGKFLKFIEFFSSA